MQEFNALPGNVISQNTSRREVGWGEKREKEGKEEEREEDEDEEEEKEAEAEAKAVHKKFG